MKYTLLEKQKKIAKDNYNYFLVKLIFKILFILLKLSLILIIYSLIDNIIFNLFVILYIVASIFSIVYNLVKYYYILNEIKLSLNMDNSFLVIDFRNDIIKKVFSYGK